MGVSPGSVDIVQQYAINTKVLAREPTTEITYDTDTARSTLTTEAFAEQSFDVKINMDTQRTFTQTTKDLRILKISRESLK